MTAVKLLEGSPRYDIRKIFGSCDPLPPSPHLELNYFILNLHNLPYYIRFSTTPPSPMRTSNLDALQWRLRKEV